MDSETTKKKPGIFGKIGAFWKRGVKGKVICIVGVLAILGIISAFTDDEEGGGGGGGGSAWKLSDEHFYSVFFGFPEDEGMVYEHNGPAITVMQATKNGNLARIEFEYSDRVIWVKTQRRYEDGEYLDGGYYIRRGSMEYQTALGAEKTVARYVEVTDKGILKKIQKQIEKEKEAAEKAKLEAEGKPFEVDAPIKSLCGFSIGATPSSVQSLFKGGLKQSCGDEPGGELVTPFRHFDYAKVSFKPDPRSGGQHLHWVKLSIRGEEFEESVELEEYIEEIETIVAMLEKKFGIKFNKYCCKNGAEEMKNWGVIHHTHQSRSGEVYENFRSFFCEWESEGGADSVSQHIWIDGENYLKLIFESDFISKNEEEALKKKPKPAKLSADEGADLL